MPVIVIDPHSSGAFYPEILENAGIPYWTVTTERAYASGLAPDKSSTSTPPHTIFDAATEVDLPKLIEFCTTHDVDTVITGAESGVPLAEALKVKLGLGSTAFGDSGRRFWDKDLLYTTLASAGVRVPHQYGIFTSDDLTAQIPHIPLTQIRYPAVVKPDIGGGSVGVRIVNNPQDAEKAIKGVVASPGFFGDPTPTALVQECVNGREYVIDTYTHSGQHTVITVCTYDKHRSLSGSLVYDRLRWIKSTAPVVPMLSSYAFTVLDALNHQEGSVHMEVMLSETDDIPCLIDLGVRPHGAGHPLKTYQLSGLSQLHAEVSAATGDFSTFSDTYALRENAAIEFLSLDTSARVRSDANPQELLQHEWVISGEIQAQAGSKYPATESLLDSEALGLVFITAPTNAELAEHSITLRKQFASMMEVSENA